MEIYGSPRFASSTIIHARNALLNADSEVIVWKNESVRIGASIHSSGTISNG